MLPIIPLAHFDIVNKHLPNGKLTMQPFTVGQENLLLQVKDSTDPLEVLNMLRQVIKECIVSPKDLDVNKLPPFLIELIFVRLRERSNGEMVDLSYRCNNMVDIVKGSNTFQQPCNEKFEFQLDLRTIDLSDDPEFKDVFEIYDNMGIKLALPSLETMLKIKENDTVATIAKSIESIYQGDEVWQASEQSEEDLIKFVKQISVKVKLDIIKNFYERLPSLVKVLPHKCSKCGFEHEIRLEGLNSFFG